MRAKRGHSGAECAFVACVTGFGESGGWSLRRFASVFDVQGQLALVARDRVSCVSFYGAAGSMPRLRWISPLALCANLEGRSVWRVRASSTSAMRTRGHSFSRCPASLVAGPDCLRLHKDNAAMSSECRPRPGWAESPEDKQEGRQVLRWRQRSSWDAITRPKASKSSRCRVLMANTMSQLIAS